MEPRFKDHLKNEVKVVLKELCSSVCWGGGGGVSHTCGEGFGDIALHLNECYDLKITEIKIDFCALLGTGYFML